MKRIALLSVACLGLFASSAYATPHTAALLTGAAALHSHQIGRLAGHTTGATLRAARITPIGRATLPAPVVAHVVTVGTAAVHTAIAQNAALSAQPVPASMHGTAATGFGGVAQGLSENVATAPTPDATY